MINIFQSAIPKDDLSLVYLRMIFGSVNGVVAPGGATSSQMTILSSLFQTMNTIILSVGILVVVYSTVVGVMLTAHEGEFMGKKWSNLWIPIRTVLGVVFLVPSASGYSALQIIMMWVIVQGVGAGDMLWNTALAYVDTSGSAYNSAVVSTSDVNYKLKGLFQSLTCDAATRLNHENPQLLVNPSSIYTDRNDNYYCRMNPTDAFCIKSPNHTLSATANQLTFGPTAYSCGSITSCNPANCAVGTDQKPDYLCQSACQAQIDSLNYIISVLSQLAKKLVDYDYDYRLYYTTSGLPGVTAPPWVQNYCTANNMPQCTAPSIPPPGDGTRSPPETTVTNLYWNFGLKTNNFTGINSDFITLATNTYVDAINQSILDYIKNSANINVDGGSNLKDENLRKMQSPGWILAGSFYYAMAQVNKQNTGKLPVFSVTTQPLVSANGMQYRDDSEAADFLISAAEDSSGTTNSSSANGSGDDDGTNMFSQIKGFGKMKSALKGALPSLQNTILNKGDDNLNPLAALVKSGQALIITAQVLFAVSFAIIGAVSLVGYITPLVLGTGVTNPVGGSLLNVEIILVPILLGLLGVMISLGATLSIYIPLIPYVLFTFGAITWIISVVEAMVAGPLVALGILSPSGQHELLGKSEPALMLLFSIFLRPALMIFGLISAMWVATVVVTMVRAGFATAQLSLGGSAKHAGLVEAVLFLAAYVFIIFSALNKAFALIYLVPQKVLEWIGGRGAEGGQEALGDIKGGVGSAAGGTSGALAATKQKTDMATQHGARDEAKQKSAKNYMNPKKDGPVGTKGNSD